MKKLSWFFVFAFMAYACQLQNADESVLSPEGLKSGAVVAEPEVCGEIISYGLFAGSSQDLVGQVKVSNNEELLIVEFFAKEGWTFKDSHLNISCDLPTERGPLGHYNFNDKLVTNTDTYIRYEVEKSLISCDCFYIKAHASIKSGERDETAFGGGCEDGTGYVSGSGSWFNYICYCWQECYEASGYVFKQECDEEAIAYEGVKVTLVQGSKTYTTYTNANGYYLFENLGSATYRISVAGAVPEYIDNQGTTELNNFTVYFYAITGTVYYDDCGEVAPYAGVTVDLKQGENLMATTTTDAEGYYKFGWLDNGEYDVYVGDVMITVGVEKLCMPNDITVVNDNCGPCYKDETAWSAGDRYVTRGNWATYTSFAGVEKTVILYAGQTMNAGSVNFKPVSGGVEVKIELADSWVFANVPENIKIQGYMTAPTKNPDIGSFANKANASPTDRSYTMFIDNYNFYGVHVDLWKIVPCPPTPQ